MRTYKRTSPQDCECRNVVCVFGIVQKVGVTQIKIQTKQEGVGVTKTRDSNKRKLFFSYPQAGSVYDKPLLPENTTVTLW